MDFAWRAAAVALLALGTAPAVAPAAGVGPKTHLGAMLVRTSGNEARIATTRALGVKTIRPGAVLLGRRSSEASAIAARAAGLRTVVTFAARADSSATTPPTDLAAYAASFGAAVGRVRPDLAVVENEEDAPNFFAGPPAAYLRELGAAVTAAHRHHVRVTNGGLVSPAIMLATWDDLWRHGRRVDADRFVRESLARGRSGVKRLARELPDSAHPDRDWKAADPKFAALMTSTTQLLAGYRASTMDYVNLHWYQGSAWALERAVRFAERVTGKRAVTNEIGQYDLSPATVTAIVRGALALRMPYVVWFASDGTAAKGLVDAGGALRPNGLAFRAIARALGAAG